MGWSPPRLQWSVSALTGTIASICLAAAQVPKNIPPQYLLPLLHPTEQVYRYDDTTTATVNYSAPDVTTRTWHRHDYDDSGGSWKSGQPLFGNDGAGIYDLPDLPFRGGVNGFTTPWARENRVTFYARTHFYWTGPSAGVSIVSSNWVDDGCRVYLNGQPVYSIRVPNGDLAWGTFASNPPTEGLAEIRSFPGDALLEGDNVVAVEVHQTSANSADVAFSTDWRAIRPFAPTNLAPQEPVDRSVPANRPVRFTADFAGSPPLSHQWYFNGAAIPGATEPALAIPEPGPAETGSYWCEARNPVGFARGRTAQLSVVIAEQTTVLSAIAGDSFDVVTVQFNERVNRESAEEVFNYDIDGLTILSAVLNPDLESVTLTTDPQAPDHLYSLVVSGVTAAGGRRVESDRITFRSWLPGPGGGLLMEVFPAIAGTEIARLTENPRYPNSPSEAYALRTFDTRHAYPDDTHENYGARISGLFIPEVTDDWVFYLASDDGSELWLNPHGPDRAGRQRIAHQSACCGAFWPAGDSRTSEPFSLQAGRAYYVEALFKEATVADWLKVAARVSRLPAPTLGPNLVVDPAAISSRQVAADAIPRGVGGSLSIAQAWPAATAVELGQSVTLHAGIAHQFDLPVFYQWYRDGAPLPGEVRATLTTGRLEATDDRHELEVRATRYGAQATNRTVLRVLPTIPSLKIRRQGNTVVIMWPVTSAPGFRLQQSPAVSGPAVDWQDTPNGDSGNVARQVESANEFYRLISR